MKNLVRKRKQKKHNKQQIEVIHASVQFGYLGCMKTIDSETVLKIQLLKAKKTQVLLFKVYIPSDEVAAAIYSRR